MDVTLIKHVDALLAKLFVKLDKLESKLLKAEKTKYVAQQNQIKKIKTHLYPNKSLQERVDNFMPYYAKWGKDFIHAIYDNSLSVEQEFCILIEEKE